MQAILHGRVVGTSQKWPANAGGRSLKGPAVAGTTVLVKKLSPRDVFVPSCVSLFVRLLTSLHSVSFGQLLR